MIASFFANIRVRQIHIKGTSSMNERSNNSPRSFIVRLFHPEVCEQQGNLVYGKRIGLRFETLERIALIRKTWLKMSGELKDLDVRSGALMPRPIWNDQIRTMDWVFYEEPGVSHQRFIVVADSSYVSVDHPSAPGRRLSVMLDQSNFEDVQYTVYQPYCLEDGEIILPTDEHIEDNESTPVAADWVGQAAVKASHGIIRRTPKPTILSLSMPWQDRNRNESF